MDILFGLCSSSRQAIHCCSNIFLLNIKLALCYFEIIDHNSNSNWTFIALNLPIQEDSKAQQTLKAVDKISESITLHYINVYIAPIKLSALQCGQYTINA